MKIEIEIFSEDEGYRARLSICPVELQQLSWFNAFGHSEMEAFKKLCTVLKLGAEVLLEPDGGGITSCLHGGESAV